MDDMRQNDFSDFLLAMKVIHDEKGKGYDGPRRYENHRSSAEAIGAPPWFPPMMRVNEKLERIKTVMGKGEETTVNVTEEMIDIANLAGIAWVLYQEKGDS